VEQQDRPQIVRQEDPNPRRETVQHNISANVEEEKAEQEEAEERRDLREE